MTTPKSSWRRRLLTGFFILFAAVYLGIGFAMTLMQRHLLYWPTHITLASAKSIATEAGLSPWVNSSGDIIGWKLMMGPHAAGSVLIVHGMDGCALDRAMLSVAIRHATDFNIYILEYPGYGARDGSPSEQNFLAAADDAWTSVSHQVPMYVVSESLGAGVAAHLAQQHPSEVSGLLMFVPYDRMTAVAQHHVPFLPVSLLMWDRYAPADWLENYRGPVKLVIGGADWVIPPQFGQNLYDGYKGPKSLQIIPDAGHAKTMDQSTEWWQEAFEFFRQNGKHVQN